MIRNIFAITGGFLMGILAMVLMEFLTQLAYPVPPGLDLTNLPLLKILMAFVPDGIILFVAGGWLVGAFTWHLYRHPSFRMRQRLIAAISLELCYYW